MEVNLIKVSLLFVKRGLGQHSYGACSTPISLIKFFGNSFHFFMGCCGSVGVNGVYSYVTGLAILRKN